MRFPSLAIFSLLAGSILSAQSTPPETRTDQIEAERQAKENAITAHPPQAPKPSSLKTALENATGLFNFANPGADGFSIRLGGLAYNSGFALGPQYTLNRGDLYDPAFVWQSFAVGSIKTFYRLQSGVRFPRLWKDHAFFNASVFRDDYPQLDFYGPGPESRETGRTQYRLQENSAEIRGGLQAAHRLRLGLIGGYQRIHLLTGTDTGGISQASDIYNPARAPGIDHQTSFLTGGFFAEYETPATKLSAQFRNINGTQSAFGSFDRFDFHGTQLVPFWNQRRTIALRLDASLTDPHHGSIVPFYLEPQLGGPDDLRGFRAYRFYDRNKVSASLEYRWAVVESLEMVVFADAGKVYHNLDTFSLSRMQTDAGFGFRTTGTRTIPFRMNVGFGREGVQLWINFYNVF